MSLRLFTELPGCPKPLYSQEVLVHLLPVIQVVLVLLVLVQVVPCGPVPFFWAFFARLNFSWDPPGLGAERVGHLRRVEHQHQTSTIRHQTGQASFANFVIVQSLVLPLVPNITLNQLRVGVNFVHFEDRQSFDQHSIALDDLKPRVTILTVRLPPTGDRQQD